MLTCNMDVEERSVWLRATPGAAAMAQPFYCTEAGNFYGRAHFATARTDKDSYILFYTLSGSGLIEQNDHRGNRQRQKQSRMNLKRRSRAPGDGIMIHLARDGSTGRRREWGVRSEE